MAGGPSQHRENAFRAAVAAKKAGKPVREVHAAAADAALGAAKAAVPEGLPVPLHLREEPVRRDAAEVADWVLRGTAGGVVRPLPDDLTGSLPSAGPGPWRPGMTVTPK
jgi:hypothetical protein